MLTVVLLMGFILVATAAPINDTKLDDHWELWKNQYRKIYADKHDEMERKQIWEDRYNTINRHNIEYSKGLHTYTMALNALGDLVSRIVKFIARLPFCNVFCLNHPQLRVTQTSTNF